MNATKQDAMPIALRPTSTSPGQARTQDYHLQQCLDFGRTLRNDNAALYTHRGYSQAIIEAALERTFPMAEMPDGRQDELALFTWLKQRNDFSADLWNAFAAGMTKRVLAPGYEVVRGPYAAMGAAMDVRAEFTPEEHEYRPMLIVQGYDGNWYIAKEGK